MCSTSCSRISTIWSGAAEACSSERYWTEPDQVVHLSGSRAWPTKAERSRTVAVSRWAHRLGHLVKSRQTVNVSRQFAQGEQSSDLREFRGDALPRLPPPHAYI